MSGGSSQIRRQLWQRDPHCYWCGRLTTLALSEKGQPLPESATIDHVRSRLHPEGRSKEVVLACMACNRLRNSIEHKARVGKRVPEMPRRVDLGGIEPPASAL